MSWVLLRGLMRERRHWGDFPDQFRAAVPDAQIVTPDLPGNGANHRQRSPASVAGMVEACRADLRARGQHGPYSLLALSLGAMVAVQWQASYPDEVVRLVLINTSMRPFSRFYQRLRWQNYPAIVRQLLLGGARRQEQLALRLTSVTHGGDTRDSELLKLWVDYHHECPVSRLNALRQLVAAARFHAPQRAMAPDTRGHGPDPGQGEDGHARQGRERNGQHNGTRRARQSGGLHAQHGGAPLLVLAGARDRLVDPRCSRRLAQAWGAEFRLHPGAGHDLPLDDGAWVAAQVAAWLAGQPSSPA